MNQTPETSCESLTMEFVVEEQKTTLTMAFTITEQIDHGIHDRVTENKLTMEFIIKEQIETRRSEVSGRQSVEEKGKVETSQDETKAVSPPSDSTTKFDSLFDLVTVGCILKTMVRAAWQRRPIAMLHPGWQQVCQNGPFLKD